MSLRETLKAATEKAAAEARFEAQKPSIIAEWQAAVLEFNKQIRSWLAQYEQDGSVSFREFTEDYREEYLGSYTAQAMDIKAGPYIICIRPVGRFIFGANGRIDMYRQGNASEGSAIRFIRQAENTTLQWKIRHPQVRKFGPAVTATPSEPEPLNQAKFEAALDELLQ